MYDLLLTKEANEFYQGADLPLARRLNRCFEQLGQDPYHHPNIKRLKGNLTGNWRYRVGDWRVVYQVNEQAHTVTILVIAHRSNVYG